MRTAFKLYSNGIHLLFAGDSFSLDIITLSFKLIIDIFVNNAQSAYGLQTVTHSI